jgi:hypothetical protein
MITPEQLAKSGTEQGEQVALLQWCALQRAKWPELALIFAIPNGGTRNPIEAARMKAAGVKAGVSDLFLPVARDGYYGLFIEMKRKGGKASPLQLEFGRAVTNQGYAFHVCDSWQKAAEVIKDYLTAK